MDRKFLTTILPRSKNLSIQSVLILGIGNTLLSDEGVGVHVVKRLQALHGELKGVGYMDGGTLSFTLAEPIARAEGLIVVDAARMDSSPGTVRVFHNEKMDRYLSGNRQSVHEVGLTDLLDISRLTDQLPVQRVLVGIEPESLDWGESPSETVLPAIDRAVGEILSILRKWGKK
ncbi:MAG: HyaD/HybD family hydrogenase maturation endopeptidase [gamma proteobacterium endosymbiont of Lamellibrachia anaximandri]|nr:HyaD/HybD family hydrogenase maturation endopeptidase [gamma proteobacterium endosymbiont of Lamellibrachia anaximandri]